MIKKILLATISASAIFISCCGFSYTTHEITNLKSQLKTKLTSDCPSLTIKAPEKKEDWCEFVKKNFKEGGQCALDYLRLYYSDIVNHISHFSHSGLSCEGLIAKVKAGGEEAINVILGHGFDLVKCKSLLTFVNNSAPKIVDLQTTYGLVEGAKKGTVLATGKLVDENDDHIKLDFVSGNDDNSLKIVRDGMSFNIIANNDTVVKPPRIQFSLQVKKVNSDIASAVANATVNVKSLYVDKCEKVPHALIGIPDKTKCVNFLHVMNFGDSYCGFEFLKRNYSNYLEYCVEAQSPSKLSCDQIEQKIKNAGRTLSAGDVSSVVKKQRDQLLSCCEKWGIKNCAAIKIKQSINSYEPGVNTSPVINLTPKITKINPKTISNDAILAEVKLTDAQDHPLNLTIAGTDAALLKLKKVDDWDYQVLLKDKNQLEGKMNVNYALVASEKHQFSTLPASRYLSATKSYSIPVARPPKFIDLQTFAISKKPSKGLVVISGKYSDPNEDPVNISFVTGNENGAFAIEKNSANEFDVVVVKPDLVFKSAAKSSNENSANSNNSMNQGMGAAGAMNQNMNAAGAGAMDHGMGAGSAGAPAMDHGTAAGPMDHSAAVAGGPMGGHAGAPAAGPMDHGATAGAPAHDAAAMVGETIGKTTGEKIGSKTIVLRISKVDDSTFYSDSKELDLKAAMPPVIHLLNVVPDITNFGNVANLELVHFEISDPNGDKLDIPTITGPDAKDFEIGKLDIKDKSDTDRYYIRLKDQKLLDDKRVKINFVLKVSEKGVADPLTTEREFNITVNQPPYLTDFKVYTLPENFKAGTVVAEGRAIDPNGQNVTVGVLGKGHEFEIKYNRATDKAHFAVVAVYPKDINDKTTFKLELSKQVPGQLLTVTTPAHLVKIDKPPVIDSITQDKSFLVYMPTLQDRIPSYLFGRFNEKAREAYIKRNKLKPAPDQIKWATVNVSDPNNDLVDLQVVGQDKNAVVIKKIADNVYELSIANDYLKNKSQLKFALMAKEQNKYGLTSKEIEKTITIKSAPTITINKVKNLSAYDKAGTVIAKVDTTDDANVVIEKTWVDYLVLKPYEHKVSKQVSGASAQSPFILKKTGKDQYNLEITDKRLDYLKPGSQYEIYFKAEANYGSFFGKRSLQKKFKIEETESAKCNKLLTSVVSLDDILKKLPQLQKCLINPNVLGGKSYLEDFAANGDSCEKLDNFFRGAGTKEKLITYFSNSKDFSLLTRCQLYYQDCLKNSQLKQGGTTTLQYIVDNFEKLKNSCQVRGSDSYFYRSAKKFNNCADIFKNIKNSTGQDALNIVLINYNKIFNGNCLSVFQEFLTPSKWFAHVIKIVNTSTLNAKIKYFLDNYAAIEQDALSDELAANYSLYQILEALNVSNIYKAYNSTLAKFFKNKKLANKVYNNLQKYKSDYLPVYNDINDLANGQDRIDYLYENYDKLAKLFPLVKKDMFGASGDVIRVDSKNTISKINKSAKDTIDLLNYYFDKVDKLWLKEHVKATKFYQKRFEYSKEFEKFAGSEPSKRLGSIKAAVAYFRNNYDGIKDAFSSEMKKSPNNLIIDCAAFYKAQVASNRAFMTNNFWHKVFNNTDNYFAKATKCLIQTSPSAWYAKELQNKISKKTTSEEKLSTVNSFLQDLYDSSAKDRISYSILKPYVDNDESSDLSCSSLREKFINSSLAIKVELLQNSGVLNKIDLCAKVSCRNEAMKLYGASNPDKANINTQEFQQKRYEQVQSFDENIKPIEKACTSEVTNAPTSVPVTCATVYNYLWTNPSYLLLHNNLLAKAKTCFAHKNCYDYAKDAAKLKGMDKLLYVYENYSKISAACPKISVFGKTINSCESLDKELRSDKTFLGIFDDFRGKEFTKLLPNCWNELGVYCYKLAEKLAKMVPAKLKAVQPFYPLYRTKEEMLAEDLPTVQDPFARYDLLKQHIYSIQGYKPIALICPQKPIKLPDQQIPRSYITKLLRSKNAQDIYSVLQDATLTKDIIGAATSCSDIYRNLTRIPKGLPNHKLRMESLLYYLNNKFLFIAGECAGTGLDMLVKKGTTWSINKEFTGNQVIENNNKSVIEEQAQTYESILAPMYAGMSCPVIFNNMPDDSSLLPNLIKSAYLQRDNDGVEDVRSGAATLRECLALYNSQKIKIDNYKNHINKPENCSDYEYLIFKGHALNLLQSQKNIDYLHDVCAFEDSDPLPDSDKTAGKVSEILKAGGIPALELLSTHYSVVLKILGYETTYDKTKNEAFAKVKKARAFRSQISSDKLNEAIINNLFYSDNGKFTSYHAVDDIYHAMFSDPELISRYNLQNLKNLGMRSFSYPRFCLNNDNELCKKIESALFDLNLGSCVVAAAGMHKKAERQCIDSKCEYVCDALHRKALAMGYDDKAKMPVSYNEQKSGKLIKELSGKQLFYRHCSNPYVPAGVCLRKFESDALVDWYNPVRLNESTYHVYLAAQSDGFKYGEYNKIARRFTANESPAMSYALCIAAIGADVTRDKGKNVWMWPNDSAYKYCAHFYTQEDKIKLSDLMRNPGFNVKKSDLQNKAQIVADDLKGVIAKNHEVHESKLAQLLTKGAKLVNIGIIEKVGPKEFNGDRDIKLSKVYAANIAKDKIKLSRLMELSQFRADKNSITDRNDIVYSDLDNIVKVDGWKIDETKLAKIIKPGVWLANIGKVVKIGTKTSDGDREITYKAERMRRIGDYADPAQQIFAVPEQFISCAQNCIENLRKNSNYEGEHKLTKFQNCIDGLGGCSQYLVGINDPDIVRNAVTSRVSKDIMIDPATRRVRSSYAMCSALCKKNCKNYYGYYKYKASPFLPKLVYETTKGREKCFYLNRTTFDTVSDLEGFCQEKQAEGRFSGPIISAYINHNDEICCKLENDSHKVIGYYDAAFNNKPKYRSAVTSFEKQCANVCQFKHCTPLLQTTGTSAGIDKFMTAMTQAVGIGAISQAAYDGDWGAFLSASGRFGFTFFVPFSGIIELIKTCVDESNEADDKGGVRNPQCTASNWAITLTLDILTSSNPFGKAGNQAMKTTVKSTGAGIKSAAKAIGSSITKAAKWASRTKVGKALGQAGSAVANPFKVAGGWVANSAAIRVISDAGSSIASKFKKNKVLSNQKMLDELSAIKIKVADGEQISLLTKVDDDLTKIVNEKLDQLDSSLLNNGNLTLGQRTQVLDEVQAAMETAAFKNVMKKVKSGKAKGMVGDAQLDELGDEITAGIYDAVDEVDPHSFISSAIAKNNKGIDSLKETGKKLVKKNAKFQEKLDHAMDAYQRALKQAQKTGKAADKQKLKAAQEALDQAEDLVKTNKQTIAKINESIEFFTTGGKVSSARSKLFKLQKELNEVGIKVKHLESSYAVNKEVATKLRSLMNQRNRAKKMRESLNTSVLDYNDMRKVDNFLDEIENFNIKNLNAEQMDDFVKRGRALSAKIKAKPGASKLADDILDMTKGVKKSVNGFYFDPQMQGQLAHLISHSSKLKKGGDLSAEVSAFVEDVGMPNDFFNYTVEQMDDVMLNGKKIIAKLKKSGADDVADALEDTLAQVNKSHGSTRVIKNLKNTDNAALSLFANKLDDNAELLASQKRYNKLDDDVFEAQTALDRGKFEMEAVELKAANSRVSRLEDIATGANKKASKSMAKLDNLPPLKSIKGDSKKLLDAARESSDAVKLSNDAAVAQITALDAAASFKKSAAALKKAKTAVKANTNFGLLRKIRYDVSKRMKKVYGPSFGNIYKGNVLKGFTIYTKQRLRTRFMKLYVAMTIYAINEIDMFVAGKENKDQAEEGALVKHGILYLREVLNAIGDDYSDDD